MKTDPKVGASRTVYPQYMPISVLGALGETTVPEKVLAPVEDENYEFRFSFSLAQVTNDGVGLRIC